MVALFCKIGIASCKQFLPMVLGETEIETMKSIKRALDPNNVLNPGKIFDL